MISEPVTRELCDYVDAVRETLPAGFVRVVRFKTSVFIPRWQLMPITPSVLDVDYATMQAFIIRQVARAMNIPSSMLGTRSGARRVEVAYCNYPTPAALHDSSFIGRNKRERELT